MNNFAALDIHISLGPETLFTVFGIPISNSLFTGAISLLVFLAIFIYTASMVKRGKYNRFVGIVQWAFEGMLNTVYDVIPDKVVARKIAPYALTIFFYVLLSYWTSILPGLDSITINGASLIRSPAADLNFTLAIMIITMIGAQVYAIRQHGVFGNAGRYLRNPFKDPIASFEGFLELIGEFSRGLALSLRLFGNCFAGEILLLIIAVLTSYFSMAALPFFMAFELFIGLIQAYVFFILTLIFTALAIDTHGGKEHSPSEHSSVDHAKAAQQLE